MGEVLFEIKDLHKSFGKKDVLKGLDFEIYKNEILGIVGKSGAGKSTFMKILSNTLHNYKGEIVFNKKLLGNKALNRIIGFSFQPYSFYDDLSLKDNVFYFGRLYGMSNDDINDKIDELFLMTDLDKQDLQLTAKSLSGGMKKRFDIVCSLLHSPKILILDEPTAGLDPMRRKQLINIIRRINTNGVTIMISSHIMSDVDNLCDRLLIIDKGKKLMLDAPERIKRELLEHEKIIIESSPGKYDKIIKYLSSFRILHCQKQKNKLIIYTPESEILVHFILHLLEDQGETLENIIVLDADLENVFDVLEKKGEKLVLKENLEKLNKFVFSLIGKKYSSAKIKEIMMSHNWPKEVAHALVGKRFLNKVEGK